MDDISICLSHMEDVDGICSNALIKQAYNTKSRIVDYTNMMDTLRVINNLVTSGNFKRLFVCDLGLAETIQDEFVEILTNLVQHGVKVTYIDHHRIEDHIYEKLVKNRITVLHNEEECTAVQVYDAYKNKLSDRSALLAACAAFTDYLDHKPIALGIMEKFDRQFIAVNATAMTYYINSKQDSVDTLYSLIDKLSKDVLPATIDGLYEDARKQIIRTGDMMNYTKKHMKTGKNLVYIYVDEGSAFGAVTFALGASDKKVSVSCEPKTDKDIYIVSIRGRRTNLHLGKIAGEIASKLGGAGGGHAEACGAFIPRKNITKFIENLDNILDNPDTITVISQDDVV